MNDRIGKLLKLVDKTAYPRTIMIIIIMATSFAVGIALWALFKFIGVPHWTPTLLIVAWVAWTVVQSARADRRDKKARRYSK